MKLRVILTGATGMVGEGVLHECLIHPDVESVLVINRRPGGVSHAKLTEIIHDDFFVLDAISEQLRGYNACFFCAGMTSVGLDETEYTKLTHDLTLHFANTLLALGSNMTFCYISGSGTDATLKSTLMWARVKGRTENELLQLPFKDAYMFRPGYLHPTRGLNNTKRFYYLFTWLYPLLRLIYPSGVSSLRELGIAMIKSVTVGYEKKVLEVKDIVALAKR